MTLARTVAEHPHAVQRDLLVHGFQWAGLGDPDGRELDFRRFVSFVLGAPPQSALGHAVNEGWSQTDHLLANLGEQHAQLIGLKRRYPRPGLPDDDVDTGPENGSDTGQASAEEAKHALMAGGPCDSYATPADFDRQRALFEQRRRDTHALNLGSHAKDLVEEVTA